ncbi:BPM3 [Scenedesmus sp. PABB004]|nr:BPM3 [Scenedesmus sp. PABB004]
MEQAAEDGSPAPPPPAEEQSEEQQPAAAAPPPAEQPATPPAPVQPAAPAPAPAPGGPAAADAGAGAGGGERRVARSLPAKRGGAARPWAWPGLQASSSFRELTTVGAAHCYTISGFALCRSLGPGTRVCSDAFDAGGQSFRLEVWPAGVAADSAGHVSVFLTACGPDGAAAATAPCHVLHEIAILDQSGRGRHLTRASKPGASPGGGPRAAWPGGAGVVAGYPAFVRAALLEQHAGRYLAGDCLVVRATVEVVRSWSAAPHELAQPGALGRAPGQLPAPCGGGRGAAHSGWGSPEPSWPADLDPEPGGSPAAATAARGAASPAPQQHSSPSALAARLAGASIGAGGSPGPCGWRPHQHAPQQPPRSPAPAPARGACGCCAASPQRAAPAPAPAEPACGCPTCSGGAGHGGGWSAAPAAGGAPPHQCGWGAACAAPCAPLPRSPAAGPACQGGLSWAAPAQAPHCCARGWAPGCVAHAAHAVVAEQQHSWAAAAAACGCHRHHACALARPPALCPGGCGACACACAAPPCAGLAVPLCRHHPGRVLFM